MSTVNIELEEELVSLLHSLNMTAERAARELIVLELYRRGTISSGKAAQLLGIPRGEFIHYASQQGIPFFEMTEDEWAAERAASEKL